MTSTREQVRDLQPGDVVELRFIHAGTALTLRGTFPEITNFYDNYLGGPYTLTVVSRARRPPLYVNHPRTEPVAGDVVTVSLEDPLPGWRPTWVRSEDGVWFGTHTGRPIVGKMLDRLRLLVDGETGQVVP